MKKLVAETMGRIATNKSVKVFPSELEEELAKSSTKSPKKEENQTQGIRTPIEDAPFCERCCDAVHILCPDLSRSHQLYAILIGLSIATLLTILLLWNAGYWKHQHTEQLVESE